MVNDRNYKDIKSQTLCELICMVANQTTGDFVVEPSAKAEAVVELSGRLNRIRLRLGGVCPCHGASGPEDFLQETCFFMLEHYQEEKFKMMPDGYWFTMARHLCASAIRTANSKGKQKVVDELTRDFVQQQIAKSVPASIDETEMQEWRSNLVHTIYRFLAIQPEWKQHLFFLAIEYEQDWTAIREVMMERYQMTKRPGSWKTAYFRIREAILAFRF